MPFSNGLEAHYQAHIGALLAAGDPRFYGGSACLWLVGSLAWALARKVSKLRSEAGPRCARLSGPADQGTGGAAPRRRRRACRP